MGVAVMAWGQLLWASAALVVALVYLIAWALCPISAQSDRAAQRDLAEIHRHEQAKKATTRHASEPQGRCTRHPHIKHVQ